MFSSILYYTKNLLENYGIKITNRRYVFTVLPFKDCLIDLFIFNWQEPTKSTYNPKFRISRFLSMYINIDHFRKKHSGTLTHDHQFLRESCITFRKLSHFIFWILKTFKIYWNKSIVEYNYIYIHISFTMKILHQF